ncbi:MAG: hypothetical protein ACREFP_09140 [Acetobacteraceae bacterium]
MPYISNAAKERALGVSLREAVEHVRSTDGCSSEEALQQLRDALSDHQIPWMWEGSRVRDALGCPVWNVLGLPSPLDDRKVSAQGYKIFVEETEDEDELATRVISPGDDAAAGPFAVHEVFATSRDLNPPGWHTLLLRRDRVTHLWPGPRNGPSERKQGAPSHGKEIEEALRGVDPMQSKKELRIIARQRHPDPKGFSDRSIDRVIDRLRSRSS